MKAKRIPLTFTIMQGPEGPSLYLNTFRIAGPKPWGGGKIIYEWTIEGEDFFKALNHSTKIVAMTGVSAFKKLKTETAKIFKKSPPKRS